MKSPLQWLCFLFPILLCCVSIPVASGQAEMRTGPHQPPWNSVVAASRLIHVDGAVIQIDFGPGALDLNHDDIVRWVEAAANAVSHYYGRFPVARARVLILPVADERGVLSGTTWGNVDGFPAFTRMRLGQHTTKHDLTNDWTMTHEFVHTALPALRWNHHWLEEGLAVYVEPIARAQVGGLSTGIVWAETLRGMPKGVAGISDSGLDHIHTWANTYWGGALFCLMADVTIREKTGNGKGLQDALRGILASGGSIAQDWPVSKVLAVGDRATGTSVLSDLYKKMGEGPEPVDLDALWKRLGVSFENGSIVFDGSAPLARIRESITSPEQHGKGD